MTPADLKTLQESHRDLMKALEYVAQLQDDKIERAHPEVILELLRLKVGRAHAALATARKLAGTQGRMRR